MRNHRIRERRDRLEMTQADLGLLAYLTPSSAQTLVSQAERGLAKPHVIRKLRAALVWKESEARRAREDARRLADLVAAVNVPAAGHGCGTALVCLGDWPMVAVDNEAAAGALVRRMADLLHDGECEAFDSVAAMIPEPIALRAGELYLDECGISSPQST